MITYTCQVCGKQTEEPDQWAYLSISKLRFVLCPDHKDLPAADVIDRLSFKPQFYPSGVKYT